MYHVREKTITAEYYDDKMMMVTATLNNFTGVAQSIMPSTHISGDAEYWLRITN
ncbi:hypothetical protein [Lactiplantibacillus plantarum]|uniref:hypothetical protein n=1 Tax=Lactiplantibacillus plantarum TaxID=1590 RepID=UPI003A8B4626